MQAIEGQYDLSVTLPQLAASRSFLTGAGVLLATSRSFTAIQTDSASPS
nr:unnamed protein product [Callosobruchus chinensis]